MNISDKNRTMNISDKNITMSISDKNRTEMNISDKTEQDSKEHIGQINRMGKSISDKHRTMNISDRNKN